MPSAGGDTAGLVDLVVPDHAVDDRVARCGIGLLGLASTPVRATAAEAGVAGVAVSDIDPDEVGRAAVSGLTSIPSDLHGSSAYRARVGAAMASRAWAAATQEALGG